VGVIEAALQGRLAESLVDAAEAVAAVGQADVGGEGVRAGGRGGRRGLGMADDMGREGGG
jgi:hypothetical protein